MRNSTDEHEEAKIDKILFEYVRYSRVASRADTRYQIRLPIREDKLVEVANMIRDADVY